LAKRAKRASAYRGSCGAHRTMASRVVMHPIIGSDRSGASGAVAPTVRTGPAAGSACTPAARRVSLYASAAAAPGLQAPACAAARAAAGTASGGTVAAGAALASRRGVHNAAPRAASSAGRGTALRSCGSSMRTPCARSHGAAACAERRSRACIPWSCGCAGAALHSKHASFLLPSFTCTHPGRRVLQS